MAAIQDLVLTFYTKMHCVPQRKLKLLMPVLLIENFEVILFVKIFNDLLRNSFLNFVEIERFMKIFNF